MVWACRASSLVGTRTKPLTACSATGPVYGAHELKALAGAQRCCAHLKQPTRQPHPREAPRPAHPTVPGAHRLPVEQKLQHRQCVGGGLPRARAGPGQQVLPLQRQRNGLLLDQRRSRPAQVCDCLRDTRRTTRAARPPGPGRCPPRLSAPLPRYLQQPGVQTHVFETQRVRLLHGDAGIHAALVRQEERADGDNQSEPGERHFPEVAEPRLLTIRQGTRLRAPTAGVRKARGRRAWGRNLVVLPHSAGLRMSGLGPLGAGRRGSPTAGAGEGKGAGA